MATDPDRLRSAEGRIMTPPVPSNRVVAHDLQDLIDRVTPLLDKLGDPDSVERHLPPVKDHRETLRRSLQSYVDSVALMINALIGDDSLEEFLREHDQNKGGVA